MNDEVFHAILDADVLYRNTPADIRCRHCGNRLKAYYCEARLYSIKCSHCKSITLVKASSPDKAASYVGVSAESNAAGRSSKSRMKYYLTDSLKAEKTGTNAFIVHLSNGGTVEVVEQPTYEDRTFAWKVASQYFSEDAYALHYLKRLIAENLTGKRIISHAKNSVPDICGVEGAACRAHGECNRALCDGCPVAEEFFAHRDGVELVYAVKSRSIGQNPDATVEELP